MKGGYGWVELFAVKTLYMKQEIDYIPVLHDVIPSFLQQLSGLPHFLLISELNEIFVFDDLRPNKTAFDVGMDDPCCLRGKRSFPVGPSPHFIGSDREKGDQSERVIANNG